MKLAAVYACIYVLSSSIAQMPLHVMRKTGDKVETARDHPVFHLVHDEPNEWQTSYKWRETKERHILGWGNGYTQVIRNSRGEVTNRKPVCRGKPHCLTPAAGIPTEFITNRVILRSARMT